MKKVLIIEDDKKKIEKLSLYFSNDIIKIEESFQSGLSELKAKIKNYDLLILDMTIPLWEKGKNDIGGNYEQFGGEKILREMKRRKLTIPTILFTMFDVFPTKSGTITFDELNLKYIENFKSFYKGAVFYKSGDESWQEKLTLLINK
ncbi:hypothetical protein ACFO3O_20820 [Dokdonia ponticola]|uniref:Response regulator n=1 Tax=Dokdonia ponticola TaxID=2041041 RepID=A0ABV9I1S5_9FLAO